MSSYLKQIYADRALLNGRDFHSITEDIHKALLRPKWKNYSWAEQAFQCDNFSQIARIFGMTLVFEEDGYDGKSAGVDGCGDCALFSIDMDEAYNSAFLPSLFEILKKYARPGVLKLELEGHPWTIEFGGEDRVTVRDACRI